MENKDNELIELLKLFISGENQSLDIAGRIEVLLDELYPEDEEIQDYVTKFALYRPGGGEYLYDEARILPECKCLLEIIHRKNSEQ